MKPTSLWIATSPTTWALRWKLWRLGLPTLATRARIAFVAGAKMGGVWALELFPAALNLMIMVSYIYRRPARWQVIMTTVTLGALYAVETWRARRGDRMKRKAIALAEQAQAIMRGGLAALEKLLGYANCQRCGKPMTVRKDGEAVLAECECSKLRFEPPAKAS